MSDHSELRRMLGAIPPELRSNLVASVRRGLDALRKPDYIGLPVWAHRHFYLSAESSNREEKWKAWPYQIGILHCMGDDNVREFAFVKSARLGYTKCLLALIGYTAQHLRRNQCVWQPTDDDSDDFCKTDLEPMLRDVGIMRTVQPQALAKSKLNSLRQKKFLGSLLKLRGGKAAGNYRRLTLDTGIADELDGFDHQIEKSGDPANLIAKRVEGATFPKLVFGSTPRIKDVSHIEKRWKAATVRLRFHITCPHCGVEHPLMWGGADKPYGMKWDMEDPEGTARHHCPHCHEPIRQPDYLRLARVGAWVSECGNYRLIHGWHDNGEPWAKWTDAAGMPVVPPERVAAHAWTAMSESPGVTWGVIIREFLNALAALKLGDRGPMVQWVNETKGESDEIVGDKADANALQERARKGGVRLRMVPPGACLLVAGVDVQDNRFEIVVWAVGKGEETWAIDYIVMDANPADMRDWDALYTRLRQQYQHAFGGWIGLAGVALDTGGHFTHQAYAFVAKYGDVDRSFRLYAVKGSSNEGDPIKARAAKWVDISLYGRVVKRGVKLWMVGTDTAKDLFYGRLKIAAPGPGYVHFAADLPTEFFRQYENEKRLPSVVQGRKIFRWVHTGGSNEVPDCTVYAVFVMHALDVANFPAYRWAELERQCVADLLSGALATPDNAVAVPPLPPAGAIAVPAMTAVAPPAETRPPPQKPQQAAQPKKTTAPPAPNPFASDEWLQRG